MPYVFVDLLVIDLNGSEIGAEHVSDDTECTSHLFAHEADGLFLLECFDGLCPPLHQEAQFVV